MANNELLEELQRRRNNLAQLELQKSQHGIAVPLSIINGIELEKAEIHKIEQILALEKDDSKWIGFDDSEPGIAAKDMADSWLVDQMNRIMDKLDQLSTRVSGVEAAQRVQAKDLSNLDATQRLQAKDLTIIRDQLTDLAKQFDELRRPPPIPQKWIYLFSLILFVFMIVLAFLAYRAI